MEGNPCRNGLFESCSFSAFPCSRSGDVWGGIGWFLGNILVEKGRGTEDYKEPSLVLTPEHLARLECWRMRCGSQ